MEPYRLIAPLYDTIFERINRGLRIVAHRMCEPPEGARVLDVGCGTGAQLAFYRDRGYRLWGLDTSSAMLRVAHRRLGPAAVLTKGDATRMPYDDASFDLICVFFVLHEMRQPVRRGTLREIERVLAPGGKVAVVEFHDGSDRSFRWLSTRVLTTAAELAAGREHFTCYLDWRRRGCLRGQLTSTGLKIAKERVLGGGNLGVFALEKRGESATARP